MRELLHYKIVERLGQGAMGEVFRAVDQRLGREVALKMLPSDVANDPTSHERLVREARAASALNHPGIVTLHDIERVDGQAFIVMELVIGKRFSDLAQEGVTWRRAVELVASVGEALAFAHARDILHRDIKADNLMVTASGQTKVLDFGLAKLVATADAIEPSASGEAPTRGDLTQAGQLVGTPTYMAPECFEGQYDARSDVFALGVVLDEMLTGRRPFDRESATATMIAIQLDPVPAPSTVVPERKIPEAVDAIVARALAKKAEARFQSMQAFVAEMRAALQVRPKRWPWIAGAAGALVAASSATYVLTRGEPPLEISIGASRRITFAAGCEEYPRLHPDGKRIVYDGMIDGDYEIQLRDLDGNNHRRLTTTPGWDYAAAISPDGKSVAYVHEDPLGRSLRLIGIDGGEPRDLGAAVGYPAWSRDGALLVGDTSGQILKRTLDGKTTVLGRLPAGARLYHLVEVPGAGIALLWWTSSEADATALGELNLDGTVRVVEETSIDYEGGLAAGALARGYYATRKAATEGNQLLFRRWGSAQPTVVGGGLSPGAGIDVAPDGKRLVFSTCVERQYIARITGDKVDVISQGNWQDTNPRVLDQHRVLVTSDRTGTMQGWLLDSAHEPRAVTPAGALGATPSLDGKLVVYAAAGGRGGLSIVELAGGTPRALTTDPSDTSPGFTHDGTHVVFERTDANGDTAIHVVPVVGGPDRKLAAGAQPVASPIDDTIVFLTTADARGARNVMYTSVAGTEPHEVPSFEMAGWQHPRFSPDGRRLVVVRGYQQIVTAPFGGPARVEWTATTGGVTTADFARDGSIVAALSNYDGDLWVAEGVLP
ncbi:MAG: protein kinase [Kofleriaceae bacterium]|nr:protein kinase [Kofleriaceae bacterium]